MTKARPTQSFRDEHAELIPHIEQLRILGDLAVAGGDINATLAASTDFLQHHLLVHASAEEEELYPAVARLLGVAEATATMSRDHVEVDRLTAQLAAASSSDRATVARVAYGLYALVSVHFAKEEEVYLPIIDARMSTEEAAEMYAQMEEAAAGQRG